MTSIIDDVHLLCLQSDYNEQSLPARSYSIILIHVIVQPTGVSHNNLPLRQLWGINPHKSARSQLSNVNVPADRVFAIVGSCGLLLVKHRRM